MNKNNIIIENARIGFRNFSGEEGKFNPKGSRNFCVFLESDLANTLENDGWNVRRRPAKDEYDETPPLLSVAVSFKRVPNIPPLKVVMVTSRGRTELDEESISILDWADIQTCHLQIRPYDWRVNGKSGLKAYLASMVIIIAEDPLEKMYSEIPEADINNVGDPLCGDCANLENCRMHGQCGGLDN